MMVMASAVPYTTLNVVFAAKPLAEGAAADAVAPSEGVTGFGE